MEGQKPTWKEATKEIIGRIPTRVFTLDNLRQFQGELKELFPKNMHIEEKIRQQLQFLRDEGYIEFVDNRGTYRKLVDGSEEFSILEEVKSQVDAKRYVAEDTWTKTKTRIGTNYFRKLVLKNFDYECCVCHFNLEPLLEAGHIRSWKEDRLNRLNPSNGLSFCSLHHKAFDKGFMRIGGDLTISIPDEVLASSNLAVRRFLVEYNGQCIKSPIYFDLML